MAGLVPFNKKNKEISTNTGFEDFYNVLDDFFSNDWPLRRTLTHDTFKVDVEDNGNVFDELNFIWVKRSVENCLLYHFDFTSFMLFNAEDTFK